MGQDDRNLQKHIEPQVRSRMGDRSMTEAGEKPPVTADRGACQRAKSMQAWDSRVIETHRNTTGRRLALEWVTEARQKLTSASKSCLVSQEMVFGGRGKESESRHQGRSI
jgi:hypothetical protein